MAYNNNYNGYNRNNYLKVGYNQRGYQNKGYNQRNKKSGAKYSKITKGTFEGLPIVNAWVKTKFGLVSIKVAPYSGTHETKSENGNKFLNLIAEVKEGFNVSIYPCIMNLRNNYIIINKLGLMITPKGHGVTKSGKVVSGAVLQLKHNSNNTNYNF